MNEENPFQYIKVRQIALCLLLIIFGLAIQLVIFYMATGRDYHHLDPIIEVLLGELSIGFTLAWLIRQLKLVQIHPEYIWGKLPNHYNWLPIIGIVIARVIFSWGIFRVSYYPLSFIFPAWTEKILVRNFMDDASKSFSPTLYYSLMIIDILIVSPIMDSFIFQGIILHRWSAKWGVRTAIIIISLLSSIPAMGNFLGLFTFRLMKIMLYIKYRTLIVPIVAQLINDLINLTLFFLTFSVENPLGQFRSQLGIGVFCVAVSSPLLIWLLFKNWIRPNEQLPYFANANYDNSERVSN